ncbi:MAG: MGMT family protein [Clostridiales bacterium]|nr:MGMT family protein [Clostridiales bacterium]
MDFFQSVYELLKTIPYGKVTTYGDIAKALGRPRSSRIVGYALHVNPNPEEIPCYKVVNREGRLAPAFAFGGIEIQKALLESEGIEVVDNTVDLSVYRHHF